MSSRQALELELARLAERYEEQPDGRVFAPLADCHRKLGQLDTALQICLTGLARHPRYSSAQLILGKIFLDRGEDVSAREALERVLEIDSANLLAIRLLAGLAEKTGDLHEAEARWRQLDALEYDPELTAERLAAIGEQRLESVDIPPVPEEEEAVDGFDGQDGAGENADTFAAEPLVAEPAAAEPVSDPEEDLGAPEPEEQSAGAEAPEPVFDVPAPRADSAPGRTSEIATLTLAGIYAEQGFRAKALEIYRAVAERNPDLPGVSEKIRAIEADLEQVEHGPVEEMGTGPAGRDGLEVVASTPAEDSRSSGEDDDDGGPVPSQPLFSEVAPPADPVGGDAGRYRRFGSWLERVRSEDED